MEKFYLCPHCRGHLKVGEYIIFRARNRQKEGGLLLLHPGIGNYESLKHPTFSYSPGDALEFFCPICSVSLESKIDRNLVHVIMMDRDLMEYDVYFSRIAGEKSTYQVSSERSVMAAGEHSYRYTYFRIPEKFVKYLQTR
jgi:hypothetical protein